MTEPMTALHLAEAAAVVVVSSDEPPAAVLECQALFFGEVAVTTPDEEAWLFEPELEL